MLVARIGKDLSLDAYRAGNEAPVFRPGNQVGNRI